MHCWNTICVCGPRLLESPSPGAQVWACSHIRPIWFLPFVICRSDKPPPPRRPPIPPLPHTSFMNPWRAVPWRGTASPCGRPSWTASVTLSSCVSGRRHSCALWRGVRRGQRRGKAGGGGSGLLSLLQRLRLVLSEQSLTGPSALSSTLLPGLNNECAGLPLVLGALISSQGPDFTHEREIRNLPSCGALLFFLCVSSGK